LRTSREVNEIAKGIVEEMARLTEGHDTEPPEKNPAVVAPGRLGGLRGGPARMRWEK